MCVCGHGGGRDNTFGGGGYRFGGGKCILVGYREQCLIMAVITSHMFLVWGIDDQSFVFGGGGGIRDRWAGFLFLGGGGKCMGGGAIWAAGHKSIRGVSKSVYILAWIASHSITVLGNGCTATVITEGI